jgi:hypothetical protein
MLEGSVRPRQACHYADEVKRRRARKGLYGTPLRRQ